MLIQSLVLLTPCCFSCQPVLDLIGDQCQSNLVCNLASWIFLLSFWPLLALIIQRTPWPQLLILIGANHPALQRQSCLNRVRGKQHPCPSPMADSS